MGISDIDIEQIERAKEVYNKGYKDGQEALAYHLELCKEEAEPCEDCISRKEVLDCLTATNLKKFDFILDAREKIKNLPPVTPKPKTDVIDKIRAEIIDTGAYEQEVNGKTEFLKGINYCLGVIDKYKAESENKNDKRKYFITK